MDVEDEFLADLLELYVYPESDAEDDEASRMEGDLIDLEPVLRDQVVLALPFQPLCTDDCPGLCPECGTRLADDPDHRHEERTDPRWAALSGLLSNQGQGAGRATQTKTSQAAGSDDTGRIEES